MRFEEHEGALIARHKGETLMIEPWGTDSFRVRSTMFSDFSGRRWALTETPAKTEPKVIISTVDFWVGDGTISKVPAASITNGRLKAEVNLEGVISFFKDDRLILREYYRCYQGTISESSRCLKIIGREYKGVIGGSDYSLTVRFDPNDEERLPICTYIHSFEGVGSDLYAKYKLQMISPHSKYSFHTMGDLKDTNINDIQEHRRLIDGHRFWVFRMNTKDAEERGLKDGGVVEVYNDRAKVLCALETTERVPKGVCHSYESCADYVTLENDPGGDDTTEIMGCVNNLTPSRFLTKHAHGLAVNSCLVEVRKWEGGKIG